MFTHDDMSCLCVSSYGNSSSGVLVTVQRKKKKRKRGNIKCKAIAQLVEIASGF